MASSLEAAPSVTVVLPTYRRDEALARALAALAKQIDPGVPWDLVVVDNDASPGSTATVQKATASFPVPLRLVREGRRGASCARNRGIHEAGGTIVAFMDDDVVPAPDWLCRLLVPLVAGRCDGVGGRVVLDPLPPRPPWFDSSWMTRCLADFTLGEEEHQLPPDGYVLTANAAFRADLLRATGGLDEVLGPRAGVPLVNDDLGLCWHFAALGGTIRYVPDAKVVHELPPSRLCRRYLVRRFYAQGRSDWLLERGALMSTRTGGAGAAWENFTDVVRSRLVPDIGRAGDRDRRQVNLFRAVCEMARVAGILREAVMFKTGLGAVRPSPLPRSVA
jgi:glycosyltransferase involved in cell wall biosynthesis